jgi:hypothetical protein
MNPLEQVHRISGWQNLSATSVGDALLQRLLPATSFWERRRLFCPTPVKSLGIIFRHGILISRQPDQPMSSDEREHGKSLHKNQSRQLG